MELSTLRENPDNPQTVTEEEFGKLRDSMRRLHGFLRTRPLRICNFSLFLHKRAPLYWDVLGVSYVPADELENLKEELLLLEGLEGLEAVYDGMHDFIPFRVRGRLPADRETMCAKLRAEIERLEQEPESIAIGIVE